MLVTILLSIVLIIVFLIFYYSENINNSFLSFIVSKSWKYNINLFSIAYVLINFIEIIVIGAIIREVIILLTKPFNARINTFGRLLDSFVKYAKFIYVTIKALHSFSLIQQL